MKSLCGLHVGEEPGDQLKLTRIPHDGTVPVPMCDFCHGLPARFKVEAVPPVKAVKTNG